MFPASVGFLSLVAVVFFFGVLSARNAARRRNREQSAKPQSSTSHASRDTNDENQAMAMAGATGTNNFDPDKRPRSLVQR